MNTTHQRRHHRDSSYWIHFEDGERLHVDAVSGPFPHRKTGVEADLSVAIWPETRSRRSSGDEHDHIKRWLELQDRLDTAGEYVRHDPISSSPVFTFQNADGLRPLVRFEPRIGGLGVRDIWALIDTYETDIETQWSVSTADLELTYLAEGGEFEDHEAVLAEFDASVRR